MKLSRRVIFAVALAAAALSLVALAGCTISSVYTFGYDIDGGTVSASDKNLTVTLEGNPTTGYEWTSAVTGSGLEQTEQNYVETTTVGAQTGTSGAYEFKFTGKSAGDSTITFTYARSWETTSADKTVVVNVTTNSSGNITHTETLVDGKVSGSSDL